MSAERETELSRSEDAAKTSSPAQPQVTARGVSLMQWEVLLGAFAGALDGAAQVVRAYQQVHHHQSLAAFAAAQDAEQQAWLQDLCDEWGVSAEPVLERYELYVRQGWTPMEAADTTVRDLRATIGM